MPKCFVKHCKNSDRKRPPGVSFHVIPKSNTKEWLRLIQRPEDTIVNQQRICSEHFTEDDFLSYGLHKNLKAGSLPSINLPPDRVTISSQYPSEWAEILAEDPLEATVVPKQEEHAVSETKVFGEGSCSIGEALASADPNKHSTSKKNDPLRLLEEHGTVTEGAFLEVKAESCSLKRDILSGSPPALPLKRKRELIN